MISRLALWDQLNTASHNQQVDVSAALDCLEVPSVLSNNGGSNLSGAEGNEHIIGDRGRFLQIISFSLLQLGQHLSGAQELGVSRDQYSPALPVCPGQRLNDLDVCTSESARPQLHQDD